MLENLCKNYFVYDSNGSTNKLKPYQKLIKTDMAKSFLWEYINSNTVKLGKLFITQMKLGIKLIESNIEFPSDNSYILKFDFSTFMKEYFNLNIKLDPLVTNTAQYKYSADGLDFPIGNMMFNIRRNDNSFDSKNDFLSFWTTEDFISVQPAVKPGKINYIELNYFFIHG